MTKHSLKFRLIFGLSLTAVLTWCVATSLAWFQARHEVNKVFDAQQVLFAERLASSDLRMLFTARSKTGGFRGAPPPKPFPHTEIDDGFAFAVFNSRGEILVSDGRNGENIIFAPKTGFDQTPVWGDDDQWRIYWQPIADGRLFIAVGQEIDYRDDLVNEMVFSQMWVWFASLPVLLAILIWLVSKELTRLKRLGEQVEKRNPDQLRPISLKRTPTEILPLVKSLNQFFDRTSNTFLRERRFTSDAAHELRSPLAALRVQVELAQMAGDDTVMREQALQNLTQGIDRATQLVEQLLTLSRLDNFDKLDNLEPIDWRLLIQSLIGERYFAAQKRQIELEFEHQSTPNERLGQPLLVSLMLRNLIDNAIKYCPAGSLVKVILNEQEIIVQDNGNGVSAEDLTKLGNRFYRPAGQNEKGSGLGLSIVNRIAELHQFQMHIENAEPQGLRIRIGFNS